MKKSGQARELLVETVVGLFILLIFVGVGLFTIVLSKDYWFRDVFKVHAQFDDVVGLRDGDSVVVRGMKVGNVNEILLKTNSVVVTMLLETDIEIREGYSIRIMPASVLGGQYLHIDQGPFGSKQLPQDMLFDGQTPPDLMNEAALLVSELRERLFDGGIIDDLERTTKAFRVVVERIDSGEGTIGKLLSGDETLYTEMVDTMETVSRIAKRIDSGKGTLGKLFSEDTTIYDNLIASTDTLANVMKQLEDGKGTLGKLLSEDDALYTDLHDTVKSLKSVAEKIERGEGLIGKLANDETLYTDIQEVVGEARATLDDFRESSPVVTFSSIFFGAF
ncbi:MAG: phospholipid/cholesterol/gamma-HCH transport system substrate-binding protein [Candidatus Promineifilaceae bacterium]|jgi:phospholipid/cholesterol/gamma-HCH transport system substrate-binding protein